MMDRFLLRIKGPITKKQLAAYLLSAFLLFIVLLAVIGFFSRELRMLRKTVGSYHQFIQTLSARPMAVHTSLPRPFANVPFGEQTGLVVGTKQLLIRGDICPYNASIVKREAGGYHIVFRYDEIEESAPVDFYSNLGYAQLDDQFNQTGKEFVLLDTQTSSPEDPRILQTKDKDYLFFNDYGKGRGQGNRYMCMGEIDLENAEVQNIVSFNPNLQLIEKNWVPFEYTDANNHSEIYFEYSISPLKLLKLEHPSMPSLVHPFASRELKKICWPEIWGIVRGGTSAQRLEGQYLAFFHSSFYDQHDVLWYCMGAYTFEEAPPFRITGISHYPILFEGIYTTPHMNTADPLKRVLFPCSFVVENELIHISCGENDSGIRIVTLNKKALLSGLKKIKLSKSL
jgi:predicted GH43/DUF377 family glycosyl hydrolase